MILVGVAEGDTEQDMEWLAAKAANMRIFDDENGVMNRSVIDVEGEVLAYSCMLGNALQLLVYGGVWWQVEECIHVIRISVEQRQRLALKQEVDGQADACASLLTLRVDPGVGGSTLYVGSG